MGHVDSIWGATMNKVQTHIQAWGVAFSALLTAAVAFPTIAETAADQREAAAWQERAQSIDVVQPATQSTSRLADHLSALHTDTSFASPLERDAVAISPMLSYARVDIEQAAYGMAEHKCLSEAIYYEARSETRSGQKAVAEVVLNRVASKHYPDTICGVVYEGSERSTGCQFSFTCDGSMDIAPRGKSWERSQDVAKLVMTGGVKPLTNRATHYHTTAVNPKWSGTMRMTRQVGSHVFYRFAPRDYTPSTPLILVAPPS